MNWTHKMPAPITPTPAELAACGPRTEFVSAAGPRGLYRTKTPCCKCGQDNVAFYHDAPQPPAAKLRKALCGFCR